MPLNTNALKQQIKQAFMDQREVQEDPEAALTDLAGKLANAVQAFVQSGTVTVQPGIPVATAGSPTAQTGTTTGPGTGTIS